MVSNSKPECAAGIVTNPVPRGRYRCWSQATLHCSIVSNAQTGVRELESIVGFGFEPVKTCPFDERPKLTEIQISFLGLNYPKSCAARPKSDSQNTFNTMSPKTQNLVSQLGQKVRNSPVPHLPANQFHWLKQGYNLQFKSFNDWWSIKT